MRYRKGYKNQLYDEPEVFQLKYIFPEQDIITKLGTITTKGVMTVFPWFAWDGASGLTYDTKNVVRGSCGHDFLYELIRFGLLPFHFWKLADKELDQWLKEDGTAAFRRWYWMKGLAIASGDAANPRNQKEIYTVP